MVERTAFYALYGDIFGETYRTLRYEAEAGKVTGWSGLNQRYWTSISKTLIYGMDTRVVMGHTGLEERVVAVPSGCSCHRGFLLPHPSFRFEALVLFLVSFRLGGGRRVMMPPGSFRFAFGGVGIFPISVSLSDDDL